MITVRATSSTLLAATLLAAPMSAVPMRTVASSNWYSFARFVTPGRLFLSAERRRNEESALLVNQIGLGGGIVRVG